MKLLRARRLSFALTTLLVLTACDGGGPPEPTADAEVTPEDDAAATDAGSTEGDGGETTTDTGEPPDTGVVASCANGAQGEDETDVDCGGSCPPCPDLDTCRIAADCESHVCQGTCRPATCLDGVQNGSETGVDCGGPCDDCVKDDAPTVGFDLAVATRFLYEGPGAVQLGVAPGTIEARRAAVAYGTVTDRDGLPLTGVAVTVRGHPEYGHTTSRAAGRFDLAVNGGGVMTLSFEKAGYLPAERTLSVPWRSFAPADDVALVELDPAVTTVDFSTPIQVARGSESLDEAGSRRATLMFRQGTTATMELPDGTSRPLTTLSVRATEYTVGPNGPAAMPAKLPASSAYTYAVELSVDEAIAAGAARVTFDQPVAVYVDNFLEFPVGTAVPVGYYDRTASAWVASDDGRVVTILSVSGGAAVLDVDGNGRAATPAERRALGITDPELTALAALYGPGDELWRVSVTHFSPWDCNWPYGPPEDAEIPSPGSDEDEEDCDPCQESGSIIDCQNFTLGEEVPIAGTPFSLHYQSSRVPGRAAAMAETTRVTGPTVPASLRRVLVEASVAGRTFRAELPPIANQYYPFLWDGLDAYGRQTTGRQLATIRVGYVYPAEYKQPEALLRSFAMFGGYFDPLSPRPAGQADRARKEFTFWGERTMLVGGPDGRAMTLGGWTLDAHHAYDVSTATFYGGDGTVRRAASILGNVRTVPGAEDWHQRHGQPDIWDLVVGADGSVYLATSRTAVYRIWPDGHTTTVADPTQIGGDNTDQAHALALGPDGSVYIVTGGDGIGIGRLWRARPDGAVERIAGTDTVGSRGDNGPAVAAELENPTSVAVAPDGTVYVGDGYKIRRIGTDGIITTIAGSTPDLIYGRGSPGDGGPASAALFLLITRLLVEPDGSLLVTSGTFQGGTVRRITPDGIVHAVAGTGHESSWDGVRATEAPPVAPWGTARDRDGRLFIASQSGLLLVDTDGYLTRIAGYSAIDGENVPLSTFATHTNTSFRAVTMGPDGNLYFLCDAWQIKMVTLDMPGFTTGEIAIPSTDGGELFVFDHRGRHRRTLDGFTGVTKLRFGYDLDGRLTAITDVDGNATRIERDGAGNPTAIVAPAGQVTSLASSGDGYLTSITGPAGRATRMSYASRGLLGTFTEPGGGVHRFTWDISGRLLRDEGPGGRWKSLSRSDYGSARTVTMTTSGGKTTQVIREPLHDGTLRRTRIDPGGLRTVVEARIDGTTHTTQPDGTTIIERWSSEPRWGTRAPYLSSRTITTPAGLAHTTEMVRTMTPAVLDSILELERWEEATRENGSPGGHVVFDRAASTFTRTSPAGRVEVTRLDARGRAIEMTPTGLEPSRLDYAPASGLLTSITRGTGSGARTTRWTYDAAWRPTVIVGPDGRTTTLAYDGASPQPRALTLPGGATLAYAYDPDGHPTSITTPSGAYAYGYTAEGELLRYTPPRVGGADDPVTYEVGPDGEPAALRLPDGRADTYTHDAGGHLATEALGRGVLAYTFAPSGELAAIAAPEETLTFEHDGTLPTGTTFSGAVAGTVEVAYDAGFRPVTERVNGAALAFTYDADGLTLGAGALALERGDHGQVTATTLGQVTTEVTYDAFGDVATWTAQAGMRSLVDWQLERDPSGRVAAVTESLEGAPPTVRTYARDAAGRLTSVSRDGVVEASFTYDASGNRTAATQAGGTETAAFDAQDRLITRGAVTYAYDRSGRLASKTEGGATTTFTYDEHGNLTDVVRPGGSTIHYVVDGQDRRVAKVVDGQLVQGFLYRGARLVAELDGAGGLVARFVYGSAATVPDYLEKDGARYRLITDQVGSVRLVVDEAGGVVERLEYSAFGELLSDSAPGLQPFGFAGGLHDPDTGLVHFWARDYEPAAGRWTARDPLGFNGGSANLYAYVRNDPVSTRDPMGLSPQDVQKLIDAARAKTAQMTKDGQRMDPGWLNNMSSALPMLDGALGCPLGICGKAKSGCKEQSEDVMQALNDQLKNGQLKTDAQWTIEQKFAPVHFWLEARSSDPSDPVLVLDPWKNKFVPKK